MNLVRGSIPKTSSARKNGWLTNFITFTRAATRAIVDLTRRSPPKGVLPVVLHSRDPVGKSVFGDIGYTLDQIMAEFGTKWHTFEGIDRAVKDS